MSEAPIVHVIGAGLAGLAAALTAAEAGLRVRLYEQAPRAGGRCRSFWDDKLSLLIDNGNHFVMSGNDNALGLLRRNGAGIEALIGPDEAVFPFYDHANGARYCVRPGYARTPLWAFQRGRSVPGARFWDFAEGGALFAAPKHYTLAQAIRRRGPLWRGFWEPMAIAALNAAPEIAQARLLIPVLTRTFLRGGAYCRPLIAREALGEAFVEPSLKALAALGAQTQFAARLKAIALADGRAKALHVGDENIELGPRDRVILAVPPSRAGEFLPFLSPPEDGEPILNAHFRLEREAPYPPQAPLMGVLGAATQWIAVRGTHVSLTISAASALAELDEDILLPRLWEETRAALQLPAQLPYAAARIIREKRATFDPSPANVARRPGAKTPLANLWLAGDWTDTGLPATIDGAILSGNRAGSLAAA